MSVIQIIGNPELDYVLLVPAYSKYKYIDFRVGEGVEDLACDRNSLGTAIQTRGNDNFSYSKARITNFGLLVEESRTNLFADNDFSAGAVGSTVTNNSTEGPNHYVEAALVAENTSTSNHGFTKTAAVISGQSYTFSVFAKMGTKGIVQLHIPSTAGEASYYANFDLENGVKGTVGGGFTAAMDDVGYGWYRLSVTFTAQATTTATFKYLHVAATNSAANLSYLGTSKTSYVWGAQLELGTFRTGFMAPATTRGTELVTMRDGISLPSAFTIYVEATFNQSLPQTQTMLSIDNGGTANSIIIERSSGDSILVTVKSGSSVIISQSFDNYEGAVNVKVGISFTGTSWIIACNSDPVTATAALPSGMTAATIGSNRIAGDPVNCFIKKFAILGIAFDVESLQILTNNEIPVVINFYLLKEDGGFLLKEDSGKIILD